MNVGRLGQSSLVCETGLKCEIVRILSLEVETQGGAATFNELVILKV